MLKAIKLLSVGLIAMSLIACGKTEAEKTGETVNRYNALVAEINAMGKPSSLWSDAELNALERKLSRLELLDAELDNADGTIIGRGRNTAFIAVRRQQIHEAREAKNRRDVSGDLARTRYNSLEATYKVLHANLEVLGEPTHSWGKSQLQDYIEKLNSLIRNTDTRIFIIETNKNAFTEPFGKMHSLQELKAELTGHKTTVEKLIQN